MSAVNLAFDGKTLDPGFARERVVCDVRVSRSEQATASRAVQNIWNDWNIWNEWNPDRGN